jgi:hypothetical protein
MNPSFFETFMERGMLLTKHEKHDKKLFIVSLKVDYVSYIPGRATDRVIFRTYCRLVVVVTWCVLVIVDEPAQPWLSSSIPEICRHRGHCHFWVDWTSLLEKSSFMQSVVVMSSVARCLLLPSDQPSSTIARVLRSTKKQALRSINI